MGSQDGIASGPSQKRSVDAADQADILAAQDELRNCIATTVVGMEADILKHQQDVLAFLRAQKIPGADSHLNVR